MTRTRDDSGVTLVELLVTLAVTGMIAAVISAGIIVGLRSSDATNTRLTESQAAQLVNSYFAGDVASSGTPVAGACGADLVVIGFAWTDTDAAGTATAKRADYCKVTTGAQTDLVRRFSSGGSVTGSSYVAYNITDAMASCSPVASCATATITVIQSSYTFSITARRRT